MSRSYVQVELDAWNTFEQVARLVGLRVEFVSHGMISVWVHCYRLKVDTLRPIELRGFFGPCTDLIEALEAFGFVEPCEGGVRIKGVNRYTRLSEIRAEAGSKGGKKKAETKTPSPRGSGGKFTAEPPKQLLPSEPKQPKQLLRSTPEVSGQNTVNHGATSTVAIATADTVATVASAAVATVATEAKPSPLSEIRESLSYGERDSRNGAPEVRSADAPPLEAGREPRKEAGEGTRVETVAVPESPAPAPAAPSPKDPVPAERRLMWLPEQLPSPTPPPESEWAAAMTWRLMRMSRLLDGSRPKDYAHLAEQQRLNAELYRDVCAELVSRVTEYQGLALLYHLDDRMAEGETDTPARLMRWLRTEARPMEAMSDAVH